MDPDSPRYPLRLTGVLSPELSRGLWLVKWLLAIPHFIVLFFLWIAFVVVSVVAFFAILVQRPLPERAVRLQRRGPPLVLARRLLQLQRPRYRQVPALHARGRARLSGAARGRVPRVALTRARAREWWLLALPHYVVVAVFIGGAWAAWTRIRERVDVELRRPGGPAGPVRRDRAALHRPVPKSLYDFVLGMNRWVFRVAAYAGLMTDAYPPFRLDMGGDEPPTGTAPDTVPPTPAIS